MFSFVNRTVFDIPLTWNRTQFEAARTKCRQARKLIDISINVQFEKHLRHVYREKLAVEKNLTECHEHLLNHEKKVHILENLTDVASQSLPNYFDKRMDNVRSSVQEHCDAIQRIIREENEHWKEIHSAIDQNLITSADFLARKQNQPVVQNIQTIDEVEEEEEEEDTPNLVNGNTITSLLTQMIRKSKSKRSSMVSATPIETVLTTENVIPSKQERQSVIVPSMQSHRIFPPVDATYLIKLEDTTHNESSPISMIPNEHSVRLSTTQMQASPMYSQPNPPARLFFSPTFLQDDDEDEPVEPTKNVLSPLDQNRIVKPKVTIRRLGQTFVLDNVKTEEGNDSHQTENNDVYMRPNIADDIPILIDTNPTRPSTESNANSHTFAVPQAITKRRTRAAIKNESQSIRMTKAMQKPLETSQRQTRKRKQSISDEIDATSTTIALRKRKPVSSKDIEEKKPSKAEKKKTTTRKRKMKKTDENEIPIREPSPLPVIDRSKHYSTRFSTRSHRCNNFTLSIMNSESDDDDDDDDQSKRRHTRSRLPKKSKSRHQKDKMDDQTMTSKSKKSTKASIAKKTKKKLTV